MKNILIFSLLLFSVNILQAQDYMDKIAEETCECLENAGEGLSIEELQMKLGLCMLEIGMPYSKKLKKDYGIDFSSDDLGKEGEKFGEIVGMKMVQFCPKTLLSLVGDMIDEGELDGSDFVDVDDMPAKNKSIQGTVSKIEGDVFVTFSVKEKSGKTTKFYWLTFVESGSDFDMVSNYKSLLGQSVEITYKSQDFFDVRIQEYRACNTISHIEILK